MLSLTSLTIIIIFILILPTDRGMGSGWTNLLIEIISLIKKEKT